MVKIFITGGTGFIGSQLVDQLIEKGHELICLTHSRQIDKPGVETVKGDITDKDSLKPMEGCDAVIANAAIYEIGPIKSIRNIMHKVNVIGTQNTLDMALNYNIPKIVYTSTIGTLGDTTKCGIANEESIKDHCGTFTSLYEKTKYEAHLFAEKLIEENGAPITIGMPGAVFGENDHSNIGESLSQLATGTLIGIPIIPGKINFIHVKDVANGLILCLEKGKNESYIIAGPEENNLSYEEFFLKAAELGGVDPPKRRLGMGLLSILEKFYRVKGFLTGKRQLISPEVLENFKIKLTVTNKKAVRELGFNPLPLETTLKQTMEWYKEKYG